MAREAERMVAFGRGRGFVASLMRRVTEQGKMAGWIAPPKIGINNTPLDYEYVRLN
jgi:benzoyl-CoA 2,3-dioxygenase component B